MPPGTSQRLGWRWLLEPEFALLIVVVLSIYFSRITSPNLRGEEMRRGQVAVEMIETGEWIVPQIQRQVYLSRPPLQNWLIGLLGLARGAVDEVAIRLPCVLAILLTSVLVYGFARGFMTAAGSLVSALAFATMGQVLELGRLGETEAIFTLVVSGSLLVWRWGDVHGWPRAATWGAAYVFAALATLSKGPQGLVFFAGPIGVYLVFTRRWRELISWPHFAGLAVFAAVFGAWQIPYSSQVGGQASQGIHVNMVAMRFADTSWGTFFSHLVEYPVEVVVCLLPWSIFLSAYFFPSFWKMLGDRKSTVNYLLCCVAVTFPMCWLVPGANTRYFMPLYPCFAVLIGISVEQCWNVATTADWHHSWRRYMSGVAVGMVLLGIGVLLTGFVSAWPRIAQPVGFAVVFAVLSCLLARVCWWSSDSATRLKRCAGATAVALFMGLFYVGVITNVLIQNSNNTEQQMAELKRQIPEEAQMVSIGLTDNVFTYYFGKPIEVIDPAQVSQTLPREAEYFCFNQFYEPLASQLDFPWKKIATISCERNQMESPVRVVVVARRLDNRVANAETSDRR